MKINKEILLILEFKPEDFKFEILNSNCILSESGYLQNENKEHISSLRFLQLTFSNILNFILKKNIVFLVSKKINIIGFIILSIFLLKNPCIVYLDKTGINISHIFLPKYLSLHDTSKLFLVLKTIKLQLKIIYNLFNTKYIFYL